MQFFGKFQKQQKQSILPQSVILPSKELPSNFSMHIIDKQLFGSLCNLEKHKPCMDCGAGGTKPPTSLHKKLSSKIMRGCEIGIRFWSCTFPPLNRFCGPHILVSFSENFNALVQRTRQTFLLNNAQL